MSDEMVMARSASHRECSEPTEGIKPMSRECGDWLLSWLYVQYPKDSVHPVHGSKVGALIDLVNQHLAELEGHGREAFIDDHNTFRPVERKPQYHRQETGMSDDYMGTPEEARAELMERTRDYRSFRQPLMAPASVHKEREAQEREACFRLAQAALLWLWHEEERAASPSAPVPTLSQFPDMERE